MSATAQTLRVGFIGLGNMGGPMTRNLAAAGFPLTVRDANDELQERIASELGAAAAGSPADFAVVDVVVTMLPDDKVVSAALFDGGIADALRPGTIVVDMSSSNPNGTIATRQGARRPWRRHGRRPRLGRHRPRRDRHSSRSWRAPTTRSPSSGSGPCSRRSAAPSSRPARSARGTR